MYGSVSDISFEIRKFTFHCIALERAPDVCVCVCVGGGGGGGGRGRGGEGERGRGGEGGEVI